MNTGRPEATSSDTAVHDDKHSVSGLRKADDKLTPGVFLLK